MKGNVIHWYAVHCIAMYCYTNKYIDILCNALIYSALNCYAVQHIVMLACNGRVPSHILKHHPDTQESNTMYNSGHCTIVWAVLLCELYYCVNCIIVWIVLLCELYYCVNCIIVWIVLLCELYYCVHCVVVSSSLHSAVQCAVYYSLQNTECVTQCSLFSLYHSAWWVNIINLNIFACLRTDQKSMTQFRLNAELTILVLQQNYFF